jgi:uncharacterized SAM-binding protein YcdF (DUF218 family)
VRRKLALVLSLLVAAWAAAGTALFVVHHGDRPARADAVVVLQGSDTRLPVGLRLVEEGYAPLLVISRGSKTKLEPRLCSGATSLDVVCLSATSTREEARLVDELARERGLRRLLVVTSEFHVFRTRLVFERCYHGELRMVGAPNPGWWWTPWIIATESAKLVYQLTFARDC